jgi:hypothetical protein
MACPGQICLQIDKDKPIYVCSQECGEWLLDWTSTEQAGYALRVTKWGLQDFAGRNGSDKVEHTMSKATPSAQKTTMAYIPWNEVSPDQRKQIFNQYMEDFPPIQNPQRATYPTARRIILRCIRIHTDIHREPPLATIQTRLRKFGINALHRYTERYKNALDAIPPQITEIKREGDGAAS